VSYEPCVCFQLDVSADIAYVMAPKEEPELLIMKKACFVSVDVFNKYLKDQIMEIIDSDKVSIFALFSFHKCFLSQKLEKLFSF